MDPTSVLVKELLANAGASMALVPALEWAKRSETKWLAWANARTAPIIAWVSAALIALGIHVAFNSTWDATKGTLDLHVIFTGLSAWSLLNAGGEVIKQWLGQHWTYKLYQGFDTLKTIAVALNKFYNVPTGSVTGADTANKGVSLS